MSEIVTGHAGEQAVAALRRFGVDTMFTLNGGHVWPLYEAARNQGVRVVDTRHEQTATFAAEAYAKLTRTPGLAVLTAGPGITNGISAITSAYMNGSPLVVLGGRAPQGRWGSGSLQELDHVPIVASITKRAETVHDAGVGGRHGARGGGAGRARRTGARCSVDFPLDVFGPVVRARCPTSSRRAVSTPTPDDVAAIASMLATAERPAFIVGQRRLLGRCVGGARAAAEALGVPCFFNGLGRGTLPADHPLAFLRTRGRAQDRRPTLVVVIGTPLDFRLGVRAVRVGPRRPRRGLRGPAGAATSTSRRWWATSAGSSPGVADHRGRAGRSHRRGSPSSGRPSTPRSAADARLLTQRRRPDPPVAHLRRTRRADWPATPW